MCYDSLGSYKNGYAIVAQLDRAFGSDPEGQRFESSRSHQKGCCTRVVPRVVAFSLLKRGMLKFEQASFFTFCQPYTAIAIAMITGMVAIPASVLKHTCLTALV